MFSLVVKCFISEDNSQIQQTPNPAAQLPWAEPLLAAHSDEVRQVLRRKENKLIEKIKTLSPITVGGASGGAGAVGELDDGEEAEHLRGPARVGKGLKGKVYRHFYLFLYGMDEAWMTGQRVLQD